MQRALAHLRGGSGVVALALGIVLSCMLVTPLAIGAQGRDPVDPQVRSALAAADDDDWVAVGVTLREDDLPRASAARRAAIGTRQQRVLDALPADAVQLHRRYEMLSGFAVRVRASAVDALARRPDVETVYLDGRVHPSLAQGGALIGANDAHGLGVTGAGVAVAIFDTGIDTNHPDLQDDLLAERCYCMGTHPSPTNGCCPNGEDFQSGPGSAEDDDGHGTAVSGIVTSGGVSSSFGVAPDAGVIALRVLGPTGGAFSDIAAGLDWVLMNQNAFADPIRVVNLSLGDGLSYDDPSISPCSGTNTANAIAALYSAGVAVFAASGNEGFDDGISFPACVPHAISVGGVYDAPLGTIQWCGDPDCDTILCSDATAVDKFVCHSNSDEILDLLAPDYRTRTSGLGGGVLPSFGGTSAASPYAAAQAALLFSVDPSLTAPQVLSALAGSGVSVTNPQNGLSFPRSDVGEALLPLLVECGNGVLDPGELCDDGNVQDGDCCSSSCSFELLGTTCDDADVCTNVDTCDGLGTCVGSVPEVCVDGNVCTDDGCDPGSGCVFTPNSDACDDGNACTTVDVCDGLSACVGLLPPFCADGNACTDDGCDPGSGCVFTPNSDPCDDADACTDGDVCSGGSCQPGPPLECDDGDVCTAESCDSLTGCAFTPIPDCVPPVPQIPLLPLGGWLLLSTALAISGMRRSNSPRRR